MKRTLFFIAGLMASLTISAQDGLAVGDVQNSGCLRNTRAVETEPLPTIILKKEGSVLSVHLLNYESNCGTADFNVTPSVSGGIDGEPCSVNISVVPNISFEDLADCYCPYNVSFTVRDLESNSFYLSCWWYKGLVELTEGEPLVLEYKVEEVNIDGISFKLLKVMHKAMLVDWTTTKEELHIPSVVNYEGEDYSVMSISVDAFWHSNQATKVTVPKTIRSMDLDYDDAIYANPFHECRLLEWIEVEDGCPLFSSVDGVLFARGRTMLLGYPIASPRDTYIVPEGVTYIRSGAFCHNKFLQKLVIPKEVTYLGWHLFDDTKNLKELYIRGFIEPQCMDDLFYGMDTSVAVYVQPTEMEKFQAVYKGPVYQLPDQTSDEWVDVKITETSFPDKDFRNWVRSQEYGADGVLTNEELKNVTSLDISRLEIHSLKGIEYFTALKVLNCNTNKLTTLDLSKNNALEKLECVGNRLTTINLLENKELRFLNCGGNSLTALDVSGCTELDTLACSGNQLTELDVSKNTKLICLECYSNQLTAIDVSKNTELRRLHCNDNQLISLDVSKNTALTLLVCSNNLLTMLDVTKNSAMTSLSCMDNKLTSLYVSDNISLKDLSCSNNQLTSLDVSGCSALKSLGCNDNKLTTLNLSGCSALEYVNCTSNQLETLDLSENTALTTLFCKQNQIKGIGMDALVESLPTVSEGSLNVMYFENEQNLMTTAQVAAAKAKGWTPYIWTYSYSKEYDGSEVDQMAYRPFVEDGKVWKVGVSSNNPVQQVDYFYFDGDTIINGKACKQMMCKQYVSSDKQELDIYSLQPTLSYQGAWYEDDKKVYVYNSSYKRFEIMYDFSIDANDTIVVNSYPLVIGPRNTGGIKGFKGVYRDVMSYWNEYNILCTPWLEGVGSLDGPTIYVPGIDLLWVLMSCTVGDEVIYFNDEYEDGATPAILGARKQRIDFTHTIKTKPKAPRRIGTWANSPAEEGLSLYGEYSNLQLDINLNPLDDDYLVRITDETGKAVYEKAVNAGNIVGLNIDISSYAEGRYQVTVENGDESFTGEFDVQTTEIVDVRSKRIKVTDRIYNLQGQRIRSLQKGLNIVNGQKVYVK